MGSLEELSVPQNSIYFNGIRELSDALCHNPSLKKLNLNDNTLKEKGAKALASSLRNVSDLRVLDIGDCLIKTNGALAIAEMLTNAHNVQEVVLSFDSITLEGGKRILEALASKKNLSSLKLDGNKFGEKGKETIRRKAEQLFGTGNILDKLDEDEGSDGDDDDDDDEDDDSDAEVLNGDEIDDEEDDYDEEEESGSLYDEEDEEEVDEISPEEEEDFELIHGRSKHAVKPKLVEVKGTISASEFLSNPSLENFIALGEDPGGKIIEEIKKKSEDVNLQTEELITTIMVISSLMEFTRSENFRHLQIMEEHKVALECTDRLYGELFSAAIKSNSLSIVNNSLPVFLGLIKGEGKSSKSFNQESCLVTLKEAMKKGYFPKETSQMLEFVISREPLKKKIENGN